MNQDSRIALCGLIARYDEGELPPGANRLPNFQTSILAKRILAKGSIISDHYVEDGVDNRPRRRADPARWIREGHIFYREDATDSPENAPRTLVGMFHGNSFGKTLIRVSS